MKPAATGLARLARAAGDSLRGLCAAWRAEAAFRQECVCAAVLVPAAFFVGATLAQSALLIATVALVLVVELLNSALEAAVDRVGRERHPLAGRAKDMASAAVFVSLLVVVVTWALVGAARFL